MTKEKGFMHWYVYTLKLNSKTITTKLNRIHNKEVSTQFNIRNIYTQKHLHTTTFRKEKQKRTQTNPIFLGINPTFETNK